MERGGLHDNQKTARVFDYLNRAEIAFELKERIYRVVRQAEEGTSLVYVMGQLQQMDVRREVIGPVMEILTACE